MSNKTIEVTTEQEKNSRLDKFLSDNLEDMTRSKVQNMIKKGCVQLNEKTVLSNKEKLKLGDIITFEEPIPEPQTLIPKEIDLDIVFEDDHIIVINKQAGLTTHPGAGNTTDTLVNGLLAKYKDKLSKIGGDFRPGIVHRLDKNTTGLMVIAKNDEAHSKLSHDLAERIIKRTYQALIWGLPSKPKDSIETNIARKKEDRKKMTVVGADQGKLAITHYKVIKTFLAGRISLVECSLETGRTHQIRVHMQHIGHPIIGDPEYGISKKKKRYTMPQDILDLLRHTNRQMLHAKKLSFKHPITKEDLDFEIDLSDDLKEFVITLQKDT